MKPITTVLFDLGNVLASIDFKAFWRELGFLRAEEMVLYTEGYTLLTKQYENGNISTENYLNGLRSVFNDQFSHQQLEQAFACIMQKPIDGMIDLVQRVSSTHRTALVSNTNEIHYKLSVERFEVLRILQKHYLSYQLHVMKPARGFYDAIILDQGIFPSKMLFIDDLTENVKGARNAGMQILQFKTPGQLEVDLKTMGVF
jgi:glucose-1-phosphatase